MVDYGNSHFNVLIQEKDLKESIIIENWLPSNFHKVKWIMIPTLVIEFLGMKIGSKTTAISLQGEKIGKI